MTAKDPLLQIKPEEAKAQSDRIPVISRGTHTHTRPPEENTKVRTHVHVCVRERQKNEDMTRGRNGAKVYVVVMKGEPSAQGQTTKPTSLKRPGPPKT